MKTITDKEYNTYIEYKEARDKGQLLTPDSLRLICAAFNRDPEKIGKHFLQCLDRIENGGRGGMTL